MDIFTIGVYGFTEQPFFSKLAENRIDTFCDIRQRRGVRGSQYAFVNSKRLQDKLAEMSIRYTYFKELSPTKEIRAAQKEADKRNGIQKKDRTRLGDVFINGYREHIADYDFNEMVEKLKDMGADKVVFFCVEESPYACHRSIVAEKLHKLFGYPVNHL
jgi:uncharacterized protein (DUF488 family)